MCKIDNFSKIKSLLDFSDPDKFYYIQLLKRAKDGNNIGSGGIIVKNFYVNTEEYLDKKQSSIKDMCEYFNARAYIRLNRRSYKVTALKTAKLALEFIDNNNPKAVSKAFAKACGKYNSEEYKTWIVDIDTKEDPQEYVKMCTFINTLRPLGVKEKIVDVVPTRAGKHLITYPFDLKSFKEHYDIDVHKDNPTILYIPELRK